jgi:tRNA C32,U32 (ribose-2'-O)-methylase TrmJ
MVVLHELFEYAGSDHVEQPAELVAQELLLHLYERMAAVLARIGYKDEGDRKVLESVMKTLRRIFGRSGIANDELRALHGICQQIEKYVRAFPPS